VLHVNACRGIVPIRLSDEGRAMLKNLANVETEGNVSAIIRKLLREALEARQKTDAKTS
jgi:hypothetical protein